MNKLEFQRRLDEVETLIADGNYAEAVNECDRLNLDLLDQPRVLQNIAKAYEKCRRYADAEDLLLMAREIAPKSRGILFHLCSVSIKAGEMEEAHRYYDEFEKRAKYDTQRFVLQYRIARAENQPDSELIRILSELRKEEPDDRWMFELARLQAKNGMLEESRQTCEDIDLWFNSGKYVSMAQELHAQLLGEAYSAEEDAAAAAEDTSAGEDSGPLPELIVPLPGIPSQKKPEVKEEAPEEDGFDEDSAAEDASKAFSGDEYESILRQETREIPSVRITSESEEIPPIEFDFTDIAEAIDEVQAQKKTRREEEA
ncbi:MAG: hypothetical protein IKR59_08905, partial [Lachnospiraceae bacterium]|nr:hypothetical protein [Lachnospiraceae bacterium]